MSDDNENYTLNDIKQVLENILDEPEVKQILNDFRQYKRLDIVPIPIENKFVLPKNYWFYIEDKEQIKFINNKYNADWDYFQGGAAIIRDGIQFPMWLPRGERKPNPNIYTLITFDQFKEGIEEQQQQEVKEKILPF